MSGDINPLIARGLEDVYTACAELAGLGVRVRKVVIEPEEHRNPRLRIARPPARAGLGSATKITCPDSITYVALVKGVQVEWEVER